MPAYAIGEITIQNPSWLAEYGARIMPVLAKHGGCYLVRGGAMEKAEGGRALPNAVVILEFPTLANARAWYNDPEYAPLIKLRQSGSSGELILVEGT